MGFCELSSYQIGLLLQTTFTNMCSVEELESNVKRFNNSFLFSFNDKSLQIYSFIIKHITSPM